MIIDWTFLAELGVVVLVACVGVHLMTRAVDDEPVKLRRVTATPPDPEVPVFESLSPLVEAVPTPLPLEDAEAIRCKICGAPLSSLSTSECWNCSTRGVA